MPEMTLAEKIVQCAKRFDADIVTFGGAARFRGTAAEEICPKLGTVICMGFRVLRGSHLGIEEGSTFYQYTTTGVEIIEETVMPLALLRVSALLEVRKEIILQIATFQNQPSIPFLNTMHERMIPGKN